MITGLTHEEVALWLRDAIAGAVPDGWQLVGAPAPTSPPAPPCVIISVPAITGQRRTMADPDRWIFEVRATVVGSDPLGTGLLSTTDAVVETLAAMGAAITTLPDVYQPAGAPPMPAVVVAIS